MRRLVYVPVGVTVTLAFLLGTWVDTRLNPPCDEQKRRLVVRTEGGRWATLEPGQPGVTQPPCRLISNLESEPVPL